MTIKPFKLSFYKSPGASSLSLRDAQPIQSTRALAGMDVILKKLSELNQEAYHSARDLDKFTVKLIPIPGSKDHGLQISGKNLEINFTKLKPETRAHFLPLRSALKNPDSSRALSGPDTISSMNNSSIFEDPLMLWTMAVSTFRQWMNSLHKLIFGVTFSPDTIDGSTSVPKKKNNPLAAEASGRSQDMTLVAESQPRLAVEIVDDSRHDFDVPLRPKQNPNYADPELSEESLKTPPTSDRTLKLPSLKDLPPPLEIHPEPAPIKKPILPAAKASEEDGFEIVDSDEPSQSEVPAAPQKTVADKRKEDTKTPAADSMIYKAVPLTESEKAQATITSLVHSRLSSEVQKNAQEEAKPFGLYLFDDVFSKDQLQSCEMDELSGSFKLTFAKEKQISLTKIPEGMSEETKKKLKAALNTTLHIAKKLKGKFDYEKGTVELDEGSLTIQWTTWGVPFTAHLLSIQTHPQNAQLILVKGKLGVTGTQTILAQDFVNFLECNITEAKRKGLLK